MRGWIKYTLFALAWVVIATYLIFASHRVSLYRDSLPLSSVEVRIVDSTQQSNLVSERRVEEWIQSSGYARVGEPISEVNLVGLEHVVGGNGFIEGVVSTLTYDGVLKVDVKQREPLLRLRLDGHDSYLTREGFLFCSPRNSAHYSLVATGSYHPIFSSDFEGYIEDSFNEQLKEFDERIVDIEKQKYPLYTQRRELRSAWREFYRTGYISRGVFEAREEYAVRLREKQANNARRRRSLSYQERVISSQIEKIEQKRLNEIKKRNNFVEKYEDFKKLITFVETISRDKFWRSEIVQIIVESSSFGGIKLQLVPRSSEHIIMFGALERERDKLDKLETFYRDVLKSTGWDRYNVIDIEYENQVICR